LNLIGKVTFSANCLKNMTVVKMRQSCWFWITGFWNYLLYGFDGCYTVPISDECHVQKNNIDGIGNFFSRPDCNVLHRMNLFSLRKL